MKFINYTTWEVIHTSPSKRAGVRLCECGGQIKGAFDLCRKCQKYKQLLRGYRGLKDYL